ncbi:putative hva22 family tb2 dp1 protein [Rosellinia necatrix]|uniref:Protein YOP1 n=1 Tax=Rosellinia necatrix TaxID=77044 RepID=A0A1W2TFJ0_ROSNE|nr:putative hva22 family tb2 dp1 protein [Rosellinia necatrix]
MFNIVAHFFASIASFLFPLFASYKALKTSDPAQLTPWLMYWSVLSCALLAESWTEFILVWVPFYSWIRLGFLLWLVLPSTQGARVLYEGYLHPYLAENELAIEDFIASAHDRFKAAGIRYLKQAIELVRTRLLNLPPSETREEPKAAAAPQGYTQALLARFSVPAAKWAADNAGTAGHDFYNLLAGAVNAAAGGLSATAGGDATARGTLVPGNISGAQEKMTFIAAQRERLAFMLGALDREAAELQHNEEHRKAAEQSKKPGSMSLDGQEPSRPPSGYSVGSGLSKSRSEVDFEKIDAPSGAEDEEGTHRRKGYNEEDAAGAKGSWNLFGWGATGNQSPGQSTGFQQQ